MAECFETPPTAWEGFQRLLGMYQENVQTEEALNRVMKGIEDNT